MRDQVLWLLAEQGGSKFLLCPAEQQDALCQRASEIGRKSAPPMDAQFERLRTDGLTVTYRQILDDWRG